MPWEHFAHGADIGIRGIGNTIEEAFEMGALALTAVVTEPGAVEARTAVEVSCEAPDLEMLFCDWINAVIYEMDTRKMLFSRFRVSLGKHALTARLEGEPVDVGRHHPAVEPKGATLTELKVQAHDGLWRAQCVVDV